MTLATGLQRKSDASLAGAPGIPSVPQTAEAGEPV